MCSRSKPRTPLLQHGSVVTWGRADSGGDSSAVPEQLQNVQQIQAFSAAFAAIRADGSVVFWGRESHGTRGVGTTILA